MNIKWKLKSILRQRFLFGFVVVLFVVLLLFQHNALYTICCCCVLLYQKKEEEFSVPTVLHKKKLTFNLNQNLLEEIAAVLSKNEAFL